VTLLIDTSEAPAPHHAQFWAERVCASYHPMQMTSVGVSDFPARMWGYRLADIRIFRVMADVHTMSRTQRDIAAGDPESMHFNVLLRGGIKVAQQDRAVLLRPHDMLVYDTSRTAVFKADRPFDLLAFQIPKTMLGSGANKLARHTAVRIPGDRGLPRLVSRFLVEAARAVFDGSIAADDAGVQGHVLDLVNRLYVDLAATEPPRQRPSSSAELLLQAQAQIEARLADPTLSPAEIARACFISPRYLQKVFADEGLCVTEVIRSERLSRCQRDLTDPGKRQQPIKEIAARWGFCDQAHFSRVFRDRFGCSPREFRSSHGCALPTTSQRNHV
jgi:AraC-like DNA-binding protein